MYNEWKDWQVLVVLGTTSVIVRYSFISFDEADLWLFPAGESGDRSDYGLAKKPGEKERGHSGWFYWSLVTKAKCAHQWFLMTYW